MADETMDASQCKLMSSCVRYVSDKATREVSLISYLSTTWLATEILNYMKRHNINANYLIGQEYDGASAMSGKFNGVQATIRWQYKWINS